MHVPRSLLLLLLLLASCAPSGASALLPSAPPAVRPTITREPTLTEDTFTELRLRMVEETIVARGIRDPEVLRAMRTVPRHLFVPELYTSAAYEDGPLPIGYGQTISQPYVVAWMTEQLGLQRGAKVLEIGTGSGYQAAILAEMGMDVYSVEIVPQLAAAVRERLAGLGYGGIHLLEADGYDGWAEHAPYDAIIVTAAPDHLPAPLVEQVKEGGRIVIPIGPMGGWQHLWRFEKTAGGIQAHELGWVRFVPLTGKAQDHSPGERP